MASESQISVVLYFLWTVKNYNLIIFAYREVYVIPFVSDGAAFNSSFPPSLRTQTFVVLDIVSSSNLLFKLVPDLYK